MEFSGFEEIILPQLAAAGASNVILIADERMTALALSDDPNLPQQLGRDYVLHGPEQASGVFHPKIVLQLGREGGRAFVGSANATAVGIGGNLEIVTEVACTAEPSPEREFVRSVWEYKRAARITAALLRIFYGFAPRLFGGKSPAMVSAVLSLERAALASAHDQP